MDALLATAPDGLPVQEAPVEDQKLHQPRPHGLHELLHQAIEHGRVMLARRYHPQPYAEEELPLPVGMQQHHHLVGAPPRDLLPLLRRQLLGVHRVVGAVEGQHFGTFVGRVVGHEQIAAIADKNPLRVEGPALLEGLRQRPPVPAHQLVRLCVAGQLAQKFRVARCGARVDVLGVESGAAQVQVPAGGVDPAFGLPGTEQRQQSSRAHHQGEGGEAVPAMQTQRQVRRQVEPQRHLFLDPRRGVAARQLPQQTLAAQEGEEVALRHLADHLHAIQLAGSQGVDDELLVVLEDQKVAWRGDHVSTFRCWARSRVSRSSRIRRVILTHSARRRRKAR